MSELTTKTFNWNDDSTVDWFIESTLGKEIVTKIIEQPPIEYESGNLFWFTHYANKFGSSSSEIKQSLASQFIKLFSHIRLYHATSPTSVKSFYEKGFQKLDENAQFEALVNAVSAIQGIVITELELKKAFEKTVNYYKCIDPTYWQNHRVYIELFYNNQRRHSTLGYLSPAEFERRFYQHNSVLSV